MNPLRKSQSGDLPLYFIRPNNKSPTLASKAQRSQEAL